MSSRGLLGFLALMLVLLSSLQTYRLESGDGQPFIPVGTKVVYDCRREHFEQKQPLEKHPELLAEVYQYLHGRKPSIRDIRDIEILARQVVQELNNRGLSLGCNVYWEILGFERGFYRIQVGISFLLQKEREEEVVRELKYRVEREVLVDEDRNMYVDGVRVGVWPFFLMPWELAPREANITMVTSLAFYKSINETVAAEFARHKLRVYMWEEVKIPSPRDPLLEWVVRVLGVRTDRLLVASYAVAFLNEKLSEEERRRAVEEIFRAYEIANLSLQDLLRAAYKKLGVNVRGDPVGPGLATGLVLLYDVKTGLLVGAGAGIALDPFSELFNVTGGVSPITLAWSLIFAWPSEIVATSITVGQATPSGGGSAETTTQPSGAPTGTTTTPVNTMPARERETATPVDTTPVGRTTTPAREELPETQQPTVRAPPGTVVTSPAVKPPSGGPSRDRGLASWEYMLLAVFAAVVMVLLVFWRVRVSRG